MHSSPRRVFILSFESLMSKRGNRHPMLASMLHRQGYSVEYLTVDYNHAEKCRFSPDQIRAFTEQVPYKAVIFPMLAYRSNISIRRFLGHLKVGISMWSCLLRRCRRDDVIIVNSQPPEFVLAAALIKMLKKAKMIVDIRDAWPDGLPLGKKITHRLFRIYCGCIYNVSVRLADYCIYTAPGFIEWIRRYNKNSPADFIPLGFDIGRWTNHRPLCEDDITESIRLVFVGDVNENMNVEPLIEAVAGNSRYTLTFIGGGDRLNATKQLCEKLDGHNIDFAGYLSKKEVAERMRDFHVAVVPGKIKYVMPNKLFDALGCFRPVLVLGQNDAARFAQANDIGWVVPFDAVQIRRFLDELDKSDIVNKSNNIAGIRSEYSEKHLYETAVQKTAQLSPHLPCPVNGIWAEPV